MYIYTCKLTHTHVYIYAHVHVYAHTHTHTYTFFDRLVSKLSSLSCKEFIIKYSLTAWNIEMLIIYSNKILIRKLNNLIKYI